MGAVDRVDELGQRGPPGLRIQERPLTGRVVEPGFPGHIEEERVVPAEDLSSGHISDLGPNEDILFVLA